MLEIRLMRKDGVRLPEAEIKVQFPKNGDFVLDTANGAKRLRLENPYSGMEETLELSKPVLVRARHGVQIWRGYERVGEQGVFQECFFLRGDGCRSCLQRLRNTNLQV